MCIGIQQKQKLSQFLKDVMFIFLDMTSFEIRAHPSSDFEYISEGITEIKTFG